jgi:ribosomal protein S18 acetylase RimI-like enzyme
VTKHAFREIDPENYEEVYAFNLLHEYSFRDSSSAYKPDTEGERARKTQNIVDRLRKGDQSYFCLAVFKESSSEMIGAIFCDRYEIDKHPACHIHGLWVHPEHRKMGLAKKLKLDAEDWAKKMGSKFMDTNVRVGNQNMISLNESLGYEVARLNFRKTL